jgi:serpin B
MHPLQLRTIQVSLIGCAILLGLISCGKIESGTRAWAESSSPVDQNTAQYMAQSMEPQTIEVNPQLIAANNRFGFNLFSQIVQQSSGENVMISPMSVAIALSMAYNGASGETQQAMAETLELQGMSLEALNHANAALKNMLETADPDVKLAIANSLWGREGTSFKADFLQRIRAFYNAEIASLDFNSPDAASMINSWVARQTADKIQGMVDQINPATVLFLINAVYFKGNWSDPFDPNLTSDRPFHLADGTEKQHPLMSRQDEYPYYETDQFQAISLPYGAGRLSMYVFLPRPTSSLSEFYQSLTSDNWNLWINQFHRRSGSIQLPRFQFDYNTSLNDALQAMGMAIAFDGRANFSAISDETTFINQVQHKTFIEVNEEGTEAAAVTSIEMARTSMPIGAPFQMVVDRPFFFVICDNQSDSILFMGSVMNPEL